MRLHSRVVKSAEFDDSKYVILFEEGNFIKPLAVLHAYDAKRLCEAILEGLEETKGEIEG